MLHDIINQSMLLQTSYVRMDITNYCGDGLLNTEARRGRAWNANVVTTPTARVS